MNSADLTSVSLARSLLVISQLRSWRESKGHPTAKIGTRHFLELKKGIIVQDGEEKEKKKRKK